MNSMQVFLTRGFVWGMAMLLMMAGRALAQGSPPSGADAGKTAAKPSENSKPGDPVGVQTVLELAANTLDDIWLGIEVQPADDALRAQLGLDVGQGIVVTAVHPDSPAAKAGLDRHDVLMLFADKPLATAEDLQQQIKAHGEKAASVVLYRSGKKMTVEVTPQSRSFHVTLTPRWNINTVLAEAPYWIGVEISPVDDTLRSQLKLPADRGMVVTNVVPDSPALKSGVEKHDILLLADDKPLAQTGDLSAKLQEVGEKLVAIRLVRAGKELSIAVTPQRRQPDFSRWVLGTVLTEARDVTVFSDLDIEFGATRVLRANPAFVVDGSNSLMLRADNAWNYFSVSPSRQAETLETQLRDVITRANDVVKALEASRELEKQLKDVIGRANGVVQKLEAEKESKKDGGEGATEKK